jgi:hypothetical protein
MSFPTNHVVTNPTHWHKHFFFKNENQKTKTKTEKMKNITEKNEKTKE